MSTSLYSKFAGISLAIQPQNEWERPEELEVTDDLEGEQESMHLAAQASTEDELAGNPNPMSDLHIILQQASKGVTESTDSVYQRCDIQFPIPQLL
jgi:hypothetical protein